MHKGKKEGKGGTSASVEKKKTKKKFESKKERGEKRRRGVTRD
jgi:hypothetical protein